MKSCANTSVSRRFVLSVMGDMISSDPSHSRSICRTSLIALNSSSSSAEKSGGFFQRRMNGPSISSISNSGTRVVTISHAKRSRTLFEPRVSDQVVVQGEQRPVIQDDGVVHTRNGVLAPPLVVDPPAVLDSGDGARSETTLAPDGDDATPGIRLHAQRTGRIQRPQI